MVPEYQKIDAFVEGIKGMVGFLSSLVSRTTGLMLMIIVLGMLISKLLLG